METKEEWNESKKHPDHWVVRILTVGGLVTFPIQLVDDIGREIPESKVDPGDQHSSINKDLHIYVSDIDS